MAKRIIVEDPSCCPYLSDGDCSNKESKRSICLQHHSDYSIFPDYCPLDEFYDGFDE